MEKYRLAKKAETRNGWKVKRIIALKDIPAIDVKKGDIGGYVVSEINLSQQGNSWIAEEGVVTGTSLVDGNAFVCGNAYLYNTQVTDDAHINGKAVIFDSQISGTCIVQNEAHVDESTLKGHVRVSNDAHIKDSTVSGAVRLQGDVRISNSQVFVNKSQFKGKVRLADSHIGSEEQHVENIYLLGNASVKNTKITGSSVCIRDEAVLEGNIEIPGGMVSVEGNVLLSGNIILKDEVELMEYVQIKSDVPYPLIFQNEKISGDVLIDR